MAFGTVMTGYFASRKNQGNPEQPKDGWYHNDEKRSENGKVANSMFRNRLNYMSMTQWTIKRLWRASQMTKHGWLRGTIVSNSVEMWLLLPLRLFQVLLLNGSV